MLLEKEFKTFNKKMNEEIMQKKQHSDNDIKVAILETSVSHIYEALQRIERNMEVGFSEVNKRFCKVDDRFSKLENKIDYVETGLSGKIDRIDERFSKRFDRVDINLARLESRIWQVFLWLLGTIGIFSLLFTGALAKGFHWAGF